MASYYYLLSSLPDLKADGGMPLTYDEFLTCCESNVDDDKFELLKNLTLSSEEGPLVSEWAAFYGPLRKELNYQRSLALGKTYPAGFEKDAASSQVVTTALSAVNPLESEKILLNYEFETLDLLVGAHIFDDYVLFGYAIKLKLLERQACFEEKKGRAEFKSLFDQIQQRVYSL